MLKMDEDRHLLENKKKAINNRSLFSRLFFTWTYSILRKGWKRELVFDDYREIPDSLRTELLSRKFSKFYSTKDPSVWSLAWTLFKVAQKDITMSWIFSFIVIISCRHKIVNRTLPGRGLDIVQKPLQPLLFSLVLVELQKKEDYDQKSALFYAFSTCALVLLHPLAFHQLFYHFEVAGMSIRSTLCSVVYKKAKKRRADHGCNLEELQMPPPVCILHVSGMQHGEFIPLHNIRGPPQEKLEMLHNLREKRLLQSHDSPARMEAVCRLIPDNLDDLVTKVSGRTERCVQFASFKGNEAAWTHIESQALEIGDNRLHRKVTGEDLSIENKQDKNLEAHQSSFNVVLDFIRERVIGQKEVVQLGTLRHLYVQELERCGFPNPDFRSDKLKTRLERHTINECIAITEVFSGDRGCIAYNLVYSTSISVAEAVTCAYRIGSKDKFEDVALHLRSVVQGMFNESIPLPWPPTADELDARASEEYLPTDLVKFLSTLILGEAEVEKSEKSQRLVLSTTFAFNIFGTTPLDICRAVTNGEWKLPKHILLCSTIRHLYRSNQLTNILHRLGHWESYYFGLEVETTLAEAIDDDSSLTPQITTGEDNEVFHVEWDNLNKITTNVHGSNVFPEEYKKHVITPGPFHTVMNYIGMLTGHKCMGSGYSEILLEAGLVTSGCLKSVLKRKAHAKDLFSLKTVSEAMDGLLIECFSEEEDINVTNSVALLNAAQNCSRESLDHALHDPSTAHISRVNHRLAIYKRADIPIFWYPKPYDPEQGWERNDEGVLEPVWLCGPVLPPTMIDLVEKTTEEMEQCDDDIEEEQFEQDSDYEKLLINNILQITRISHQGFIQTNTGEIMNIITNDINRFDSVESKPHYDAVSSVSSSEDNHQVPSDVNVTEDSDKEDISKDHKQTFCETDTICSILPDTSSDTNIQKTPTWSTFNSLIGEPQPIWNVGIAAPLYRRSPTKWPVLLTILMQAQNINCITVGEGSRPIVTLNGDLYDRAVKIKDYEEKGQVKVLLIFTAATRRAGWKLHLSTTEELLHYFHAHDQYNYGRWGPLYVADMLELQLTDLDTWSFLNKGNFVISKHSVPFTAIDPDHAIEQEHKQMKMKGGFIGITGNEQAMEKHFVIAPTLSRIVQEFKEYAGIDNRRACSLHHELTSEKSSKLVRNAAKLVGNINMQGNPFLKNDMYNLMTFAVAPDDVSKDIEYRD
ncbi:Cystic fibrosis transmembrane conductance regulator [Nymphon striatum]|nr:Cystic fibrosis transmembrane conductance regulator [Nymphon striatum]